MTSQIADTASTEGQRGLELVGIEKSYGGVHALRSASLTMGSPGSVHALIGANGSGKSTLLGVASGQVRPDAGQMLLDSKPVAFSTPGSAVRHGVSMVAQETAVAPHLSATENILMGRLLRGRFGVNWAASNDLAAKLLEALQARIDPRSVVGTLRPDQQQLVEIARALASNAKTLILDEPTSSLSEDEVTALSSVIRETSKLGVSVLLVSHHFQELFDLCTGFTVLRDGRTVLTGDLHRFSASDLVRAMIGSAAADDVLPRTGSTKALVGRADLSDLPAGPPALSIEGVTGSALNNVSIRVARGEIVGVAGLVGSGRQELLETVFGLRPIVSGRILIDGATMRAAGPRELISRGVGYLPPDRKVDGLVLSESISSNLLMTATRAKNRFTTVETAPTPLIMRLAERMRLRAGSLKDSAASLSGGNQQKVALGKWLAAESKLLLLNEPTRGVDVVAKSEIHELLRKLSSEGTSILMSSSEDEELLALCDRVLVLVQGRVVADVPAWRTSTEEIAHLTGGRSHE